jgi:hypothetical protein
MKTRWSVALACVSTAALACSTSNPAPTKQDGVVSTTGQTLSFEDTDSDAKGDIALDLSGFSALICNANASASGDGTIARAETVLLLLGTITLHLDVNRHGEHGAVSAVTLDVAPDLTGMTATAAEGVVPPLTIAQVAAGQNAGSTGNLHTAVRGDDIELFQTSLALNTMLAAFADASGTTMTPDGGAGAAADAFAFSQLVMNVDVLVKRPRWHRGTTLVSAQITTVQAFCVPSVNVAPTGQSQASFSLSTCTPAPDGGEACSTLVCHETCTKSQADAGQSCVSECQPDGG